MIKIWSLRYSPARGSYFVMERECLESTIQQWLKIYREDEPNVIFIGSKRKPPLKSGPR
jgi:hypothetical protein